MASVQLPVVRNVVVPSRAENFVLPATVDCPLSTVFPRHLMLVVLEILLAAGCPAQSQFHRSLGASAVGGIFCAFVERHDDVGAESDLRCHGIFWTEEVRGAIEMRAKSHAFFVNFSQLVQAEDLEAAGIGKIARGHAMKPCSPPNWRTVSTPGRKYKW